MHDFTFVSVEVLTVVIMKSAVFSDVLSISSPKFRRSLPPSASGPNSNANRKYSLKCDWQE